MRMVRPNLTENKLRLLYKDQAIII